MNNLDFRFNISSTSIIKYKFEIFELKEKWIYITCIIIGSYLKYIQYIVYKTKQIFMQLKHIKIIQLIIENMIHY